MRYLPVDQGGSSAFDIFTREPVRVTYDRKCGHPNPPVSYDYADRRAKGMPKFYGTCCPDCGRILTRERLV